LINFYNISLSILLSWTIYKYFRSSPSEMKGSVAQRHSSNHHSWEWKPLVSMRPHTTPSWSAMSTSVKTCTLTLSCQEAPLCSLVLLIVCKRKSQLWLHQPWRSRSLLHQRGNTLYGLEDPSLLPFPPSNRCGSASKNMTNLDHQSSTGNASKFCAVSQMA